MKASVKKEGEYIQIFACIKISYLAHYDIGISESERQKRKESNKISTKINFFAWTIEVPAHEKRKINSKCLPQLAGLLFMVLPTSIPSPVRLILNREQNSHIFFFYFRAKLFSEKNICPAQVDISLPDPDVLYNGSRKRKTEVFGVLALFMLSQVKFCLTSGLHLALIN